MFRYIQSYRIQNDRGYHPAHHIYNERDGKNDGDHDPNHIGCDQRIAYRLALSKLPAAGAVIGKDITGNKRQYPCDQRGPSLNVDYSGRYEKTWCCTHPANEHPNQCGSPPNEDSLFLGIFAPNRWCDCHRFVGVKIAHAWCLVLSA